MLHTKLRLWQSKMRLLASVLFMCVAARAERLLGTETFKEAAEKLITPRNFTMSVADDDGLEIGRISVRGARSCIWIQKSIAAPLLTPHNRRCIHTKS